MALNTIQAGSNALNFGLVIIGDGTSTVFKADLSKWPFIAPISGASGVFTAEAEFDSGPAGYTTTVSASVSSTVVTITFGTAPPAQTGFLNNQVSITVFLLFASL